jgi:hypothetical protein
MKACIKILTLTLLSIGLFQSIAHANDDGTTNVYRCQQYTADFKNHIWKGQRFYHEAATAEEFMATESAKLLDLRNCKVWLDSDNSTHWEW